MAVIKKVLVAVIDARTTSICLAVAGQVRPLDADFQTPNGPMPYPPFHYHCRSIAAPFLAGTVVGQVADASGELFRRAQETRAKNQARAAAKPRPGKRRQTLTRRRAPVRKVRV